MKLFVVIWLHAHTGLLIYNHVLVYYIPLSSTTQPPLVLSPSLPIHHASVILHRLFMSLFFRTVFPFFLTDGCCYHSLPHLQNQTKHTNQKKTKQQNKSRHGGVLSTGVSFQSSASGRRWPSDAPQWLQSTQRGGFNEIQLTNTCLICGEGERGRGRKQLLRDGESVHMYA